MSTQTTRNSATEGLADAFTTRAPSFHGVLEVVHSISGRMRVKIPAMKADTVLASHILKALSPVKGIREITANPMLGTLLIKYDPYVLTPVIVVSALTYCFDFESALKARKSILVREFSAIGFALNQAVLQRSRGIFDIKAIMTLLLLFQLATAIPFVKRKFGLTQTASLPINIIWWLYQSLGAGK